MAPDKKPTKTVEGNVKKTPARGLLKETTKAPSEAAKMTTAKKAPARGLLKEMIQKSKDLKSGRRVDGTTITLLHSHVNPTGLAL